MYVYDFCAANAHYTFWMFENGSNATPYVDAHGTAHSGNIDARHYAQGTPYATEPYILEVGWFGKQTGTRLAAIYNYTTQLWDKLLTSDGDPTQLVTTCVGVMLVVPTPADIAYYTSAPSVAGDTCITNDASGTGSYYQFTTELPNGWRAVATQS